MLPREFTNPCFGSGSVWSSIAVGEADSSAALRNDKQSRFLRCATEWQTKQIPPLRYGMTNKADSSAALRNDKQSRFLRCATEWQTKQIPPLRYGMTNKADSSAALRNGKQSRF